MWTPGSLKSLVWRRTWLGILVLAVGDLRCYGQRLTIGRYAEFSLQPNQVLKFVAAEALSAVCVSRSRQ